MNPENAVIVAGGVNLLIQAIAMFANYKVVDWRLSQVERKVTTHDEFAERLTRIEVKVIHLEDRRKHDLGDQHGNS